MDSPSRYASYPKKRPDELGFYMPDSPYAKRDNSFHNNKKEVHELVAGGAARIAQAANDVFDEHHKGRKWSMTLALMALKTGAFRPLTGVKGPLCARVRPSNLALASPTVRPRVCDTHGLLFVVRTCAVTCTHRGGYDEDGIDLNIPEDMIKAAKSEAESKIRVAARKLWGRTL